MKKPHFILTFFLLVLYVNAQQNSIVISNPKMVGFNYEKNADIFGNEYLFSDRIEEAIISKDGFAAVTLRGLSKNGKYLNNNGNFISYNFKEYKVNWDRKINFQKENVVFLGDRPFLLKPGTVTALDKNTGIELWTSKSELYRVDPEFHVAISYKFNSMNPSSDKMEGLDLETGKVIWSRSLDRSYGWDDIQKLNDSTLLISSSGLHTVNLLTGEGWDYKAQTGKKQTGEMVAKSVGSVVLGVLTGVVVTPNLDLITGIVSNTLVDSDAIYLASADKISRLDRSGNVIWSNELPKDKSSASEILKENGTIVLVNKGHAYENGRFREYGTPCLSQYDENDGSLIFSLNFDEKKIVLNDVEIIGDTLTMLFSDRIRQFSMADSQLISEKIFDTSDTGYLYNIVNKDIFLQNNDSFELAEPDSKNILITTSLGSVIKLNPNMEIEQEWVKNQFFKKVGNFTSKKMLYNDGSVVVIDDSGKKTAGFTAGENAKLVGKYMYETSDKVLKINDLSDIVND